MPTYPETTLKLSHALFTATGDIIAAVVTDTPRNIGGQQKMREIRVVRIPAGTKYKRCRTPGVDILDQLYFAADRPRQVALAKIWALDRIEYHAAKIAAA